MVFSKDSRVEIPCILHLVKLGYKYLSLKDATWDGETYIFTEVFHDSISHINPDLENQHLSQLRDWLLPMLTNGQVTVA